MSEQETTQQATATQTLMTNHPFQFFKYENGVLKCDELELSKLAQEFGTPLYVYSAAAFLGQFERLKMGLQGLDFMICFAMKSCSNLSILRLLSKSGAGVDVVSGGELFRAKKAGVPSSKVVFSGVGKTPQEMREGIDLGIYSFHIESFEELIALDQTAQAMGKTASVALRFNPDVDPKTHPYISTGIKKNKFGMTRSEIGKILTRLPEMKGICLKGLSIHIGSQLLSLAPLGDAFQRLVDLIDELQVPLEYVDMGGGLGISYYDEIPPSVEEYCALIHRYFGQSSRLQGKLKIVLEPGRQISGNAGVLLTQVLYRKPRSAQDFLIVDAAMTDLIRPALYGSYHHIVPLDEKAAQGPGKKTTVVGPVCESSDFLAKGRILPLSLNKGDFVAVLSAGAYGFAMSSQYNSRPRPAEVLVQDGKARLIRKRESYASLILGEEL